MISSLISDLISLISLTVTECQAYFLSTPLKYIPETAQNASVANQ